MTKQIKLAALAACLSTAAFTVGCGGGQAAHTIDTGSSESITTVGHIDDQDWASAANKLTNSMMSSNGLFDSNGDGSKKRLAISRIINNTREVVDTDLLIKQIRVPLLKSGKVTVTTIGGLTVEDSVAKRDTAQSDFASGDGTPVTRLPDYTLSGKLIENHTTAGDVHQSTFYFQMTLTNAKTGDSVWEDQTPITKIGSHASVGM
jgi:penicillin-binding protein activator